MILNSFRNFPRDLWITLWATHAQSPETLAARGFGKDCLLSRHLGTVNEIKHLAQIRGNTMLRRNRCGAAKGDRQFWG
jgi:hypothetical protein